MERYIATEHEKISLRRMTMAINSFDQCRLHNEQRWQEVAIEIQKIRDEQESMAQRLTKQEEVAADIQKLSASVASLATSMDALLKEQQAQNQRLIDLERKPIKRFDSILDTVIKLVITAAVGAILIKIGLQ